MRTKKSSFGKAFLSKKRFALAEIAIVLCSLFLVATLPAIAAEQTTQKVSANTITTASEDDFILDIYGNANEDDTIDMGDVVYTKLAIFGKKPKTELCDAKYDGRINVLDVIQTKLIILGKEKELTVIDSADRTVTVNKPIKSIVITHPCALETLRSLKVPEDIIVGIAKDKFDTEFFPEINDIPNLGWRWTPDIEVILNLHPDVVITRFSPKMDALQDACEAADIPVLRFRYKKLDLHQEEAKKLGYVFGKQNEAEEYLDWREKIVNSIKEKVEKLSEEDKPKVYFEAGKPYQIYGEWALIAMAGGKDILADYGGSYMIIDPEAVIERGPDIIVKICPYLKGVGYGVEADDTLEIERGHYLKI